MIKYIFNLFKYKKKKLINVLACDRILNWFIFDIDAITPCCEMPHNGELNLSLYDHNDHDDLIQRKINLIQEINLNNEHICRKCYRLQIHNTITYKDFLPKIISLSFDKSCNIRCSYCFMASPEVRKTLVRSIEHNTMVRKKIMDLFGQFPKNSVERVGWTGGEPFLMPDFEPFYEKIISMNPYALSFYTNLTHYKESVRPQRTPHKISIVCSLDAGTPETYYKIKGRDYFYSVIENIKKYCSINQESIVIKYIFCHYNYSTTEIDAFFKIIKDAGVTNVRISFDDFASEYPTQDILDGMLYFIKTAKEKNYCIDSTIRMPVKEVDALLPKATGISL